MTVIHILSRTVEKLMAVPIFFQISLPYSSEVERRSKFVPQGGSCGVGQSTDTSIEKYIGTIRVKNAKNI